MKVNILTKTKDGLQIKITDRIKTYEFRKAQPCILSLLL